MDYPMHKDSLSTADSLLLALTKLEADMKLLQSTFYDQYCESYGKTRDDAHDTAGRLEISGASPADPPLMQKYAASYGSLMNRKAKLLADNPIQAETLATTEARKVSSKETAAIIPHWKPSSLKGHGASLDDLAEELRATRYINEQLLLQLRSMRTLVERLERRPCILSFHFKDMYVILSITCTDVVRVDGKWEVHDASDTPKFRSFSYAMDCPVGLKPEDLTAMRFVKTVYTPCKKNARACASRCHYHCCPSSSDVSTYLLTIVCAADGVRIFDVFLTHTRFGTWINVHPTGGYTYVQKFQDIYAACASGPQVLEDFSTVEA